MEQDLSYQLAAAGNRIRALDTPMSTQMPDVKVNAPVPQTAQLALVQDAMGIVKAAITENHDTAQQIKLQDIQAKLQALQDALLVVKGQPGSDPLVSAEPTKGLGAPEYAVRRDLTGYIVEQRELDEQGACGCRKASKELGEPSVRMRRTALGWEPEGD